MKISLFILLFLLILANSVSFCYSQESGGIDHYYDQFSDQHFAEEKKSAFVNVLWILIPGILIWFAYYLSAGKDYTSAIKIFFSLCFLATIVPIVGFNIQKSNLITKENQTRYSKNPVHVMRMFPLAYGMAEDEVIRKWGSPRSLSSGFAGGEELLYSRIELNVKFRFMGSYSLVSMNGSRELYLVKLIFRDGILVDSEPSLALIKEARVPKIAYGARD